MRRSPVRRLGPCCLIEIACSTPAIPEMAPVEPEVGVILDLDAAPEASTGALP